MMFRMMIDWYSIPMWFFLNLMIEGELIFLSRGNLIFFFSKSKEKTAWRVSVLRVEDIYEINPGDFNDHSLPS